jgi:ADP-heptose:LPS heptosyltransferase
MHILLVRFSSMGDVVLQTATINWLRSLYGQSLQLSFVTSQEFVSLIDTHPGLNHVISFNRRGGEKWSDLIKKIDDLNTKQPVDLILDMHATLRSFRLRVNFWTTPALTVDKRRWERFLLTKLKGVFFKRLIGPKVFGLEPQVERIINDFETIFFDNRGVRRTKEFVHGPHEEMTTLGALPEYKIAGEYVVLAPSASFVPKRWPIKSFVALAQKLLATTSYKIVVLAGPEDKFCEAFQEINSDRLINLQGKTSLKESMSILSRTKVCIGNDSGMNHIAEAHGVPCLTIFGPTDPRFGFAPHANKSRYLSQELWCKPCSTTGSKACFRDKLYCMEEISVDKVFETYLSMGVNS